MPRTFRKAVDAGRVKQNSRIQRIILGQTPERPIKVKRRSVLRRDMLRSNPSWWILHRRGFRRPRVGVDPLEARAVSKDMIRGTLPERIVYRWLVSHYFTPNIDFDFQSCVASDHRVLTADLRWVRAGDLCVGDKLVSFDEHGPRRNYKIGTVIANRCEEVNVLKVSLSDGTHIYATPEHPWLAYCDLRQTERPIRGSALEWWRTDQLRPGLEIPKPFQVWDENTSWDAGYLAGFFDGEGSLVQSPQAHEGYYINLTAAQNKGPTLTRFIEAVERTGFDFSVYDYDGKYKRSYDDATRKAVSVRINGGMPEALRFLGTIRPPRLLQKLSIHKLGGLTRGKKVTITSIETGYRKEIARLGVDAHTYIAEGFCMHNSLEGGRLEMGGMVVDFLFPQHKLVVQVDGPTHFQHGRERKDAEQAMTLAAMGYRVEALPMDLIYDEPRFEDECRRIFNLGAWGRGLVYSAQMDDLVHTLPDLQLAAIGARVETLHGAVRAIYQAYA